MIFGVVKSLREGTHQIMNRPRLLRALRITWTAFWGIACLLLICLWVRSYSWVEIIHLPIVGNSGVNIGYVPGLFAVGTVNSMPHQVVTLSHMPPSKWSESLTKDYPGKTVSQIVGGILISQHASTILVPFWGSAIGAVLVGLLPLSRTSQYSLRTLLIAITLVGLGLGTIIALSR